MKRINEISKLISRLIIMSMTFLFASESLSAQLIVQRIVDTTIASYLNEGNFATYELDVDEDGIINMVFSTKIYACTGDYNSGVSKFSSLKCNDDDDYTEFLREDNSVKKMNFGELIESSSSSTGFQTGHVYFMVSNDCNLYGAGNWYNGQAYLGFRFGSNETFYYGWIYLTVSTLSDKTEITIHNYAYCTISNYVITAGQTEISVPTDAISNLQIADISDNGDGRDLEVSFNKIDDESSLQEYRIMVVKATDSYAFNLEKADTVTNYFSVLPTGNNIITILNQNSKDVNGDLIRTNLGYRIYVLSVANGTFANINALSERSEMITLIGGSFIDDHNSIFLSCYPNPTGSLVNFSSEHIFELVEVYDVTGTLLFVQNVNQTHGIIDISGCNNGSYYLVFKSDKLSVVKSLIKLD